MNPVSIIKSSSFRLTSLFMLVFVGATLIITQWTDEAMEDFFENQAQAFVEGLMLDNLDFAREFGAAAFAKEIEEISALNHQSREIFVLFDDNCNVVAGAPGRLMDTFSRSTICRELENTGGVRVFDLPRQISNLQAQPGYENTGFEDDEAVANLRALPTGGSLLIVLLVPEIEQIRDFLDSTLTWVVALMLFVGLGGAIFLTRAVSRRLEKVNAMSKDIRLGDLSRRIPLDGSGDEFDNLSQNLNSMLDQIERVVSGSKQVTNDIAHDLRTPLTRIQVRIETLQSKLAKDSAAREQLRNIASDAAILLEMFDSLLNIAGIESGRVTKSFSKVDFSEICKDAVDLLEPLAEDKSIKVMAQLGEPALVKGDRNLLFQTVNNIIGNAIKYSPVGSYLGVSLKAVKDCCLLEVTDEGPGIPESEMENVFDRFYRLESHRSTEGYGLGLSLVLAVVELHGGTIRVKNLSCGLEFHIELPLWH